MSCPCGVIFVTKSQVESVSMTSFSFPLKPHGKQLLRSRPDDDDQSLDTIQAKYAKNILQPKYQQQLNHKQEGCGNGGIGYEYCRAFEEQNCQVLASDITHRMQDMLDLKSDNNINTVEFDVSSDESVSSAVDTVLSKYGRIDILMNNAGIGSTGPLAELPLDAIRKAWEINTLGQIRLVQHVVPPMALRRSGSIVGAESTPWTGSYCASKAAVIAMP